MSEQKLLNLYNFDRPALGDLLAGWGYSDYYADLLWRYLYQPPYPAIADMHGLRPDLRARLASGSELQQPRCVLAQESKDGTRKYLLSLADGEQIETVLMPYRDRYTVCISTQAGCAMGCVFCATGQMGFRRNLTAGEIVAQVLFAANVAQKDAPQRRLRNVVMMGMGEPLHNYDETTRAIRILTEDTGMAIGPRYITLSTVGLVPAIRRLARENLGVNLAVSLHGATDEQRNALVPLGRRWSLDDVVSACRDFCKQTNRRIFFEWTLIDGANDSPQQAHALGRLLSGLDAHVNLIPLNPTGDFDGAASHRAAITQFKAVLEQHGIPSTVRQRRGIDIDAGCGQLRRRAPDSLEQGQAVPGPDSLNANA
ncbi:MAG: 23S rRNA (adenine(2503)-C(2))-methyltransferase RlmN [Chloroflexota bacterium]